MDQLDLISVESKWQEQWGGMPEYVHEDLRPYQQIVVNFDSLEDVQAFAKLVEQKLSPETDTIWFPKKTPEMLKDKHWISES